MGREATRYVGYPWLLNHLDGHKDMVEVFENPDRTS